MSCEEKLLSVLVMLAMVLSLVPVTALAAESQDEENNVFDISRVVAVADAKGNTAENVTATPNEDDSNVDVDVEITVDTEYFPPTVSGDGTGDSNVLAYWVGVGIMAPSGYDIVEFERSSDGTFTGGYTPNNPALDEFLVGTEVKEGFAIWINAADAGFALEGIIDTGIKNGTVTPDKTTAKKDETVTLTVTPDKDVDLREERLDLGGQ